MQSESASRFRISGLHGLKRRELVNSGVAVKECSEKAPPLQKAQGGPPNFKGEEHFKGEQYLKGKEHLKGEEYFKGKEWRKPRSKKAAT